MGLKLFNVLLACLTAFLAFLTARKIGITKAWLAIAFVILTPMYFLMTLTGLTEIQFGSFSSSPFTSFSTKNILLPL